MDFILALMQAFCVTLVFCFLSVVITFIGAAFGLAVWAAAFMGIGISVVTFIFALIIWMMS